MSEVASDLLRRDLCYFSSRTLRNFHETCMSRLTLASSDTRLSGAICAQFTVRSYVSLPCNFHSLKDSRVQACGADMVHSGGSSVGRNDAAATGPLVQPSPQMSPERSVEAQLDALSSNDIPRIDHGLEVMYHFAHLSGSFEGGGLPRYFGYASDLYHFGHFALKFKTTFPFLVDVKDYEIIYPTSLCVSKESAEVKVKIESHKYGSKAVVFVLARVSLGALEPMWLVESIIEAI